MFLKNALSPRKGYLVGLIVFCALLAALPWAYAEGSYYNKPYLTWQGDPSTTMTVNFQTAEKPEKAAVTYAVGRDTDALSEEVGVVSSQIPGLPDGRYINTAELTGLQPGAEYTFKIAINESLSDAYVFKTIPDTDAPLRFAIGGDTLATHIFDQLLEQVAAKAPCFLVVGGDLAYANGNFEEIGRWESWWEMWHKHDISPEGHLIPLVMAIGNHETNKLVGSHEVRAPFYYGFFPQGGSAFFARQFGANLGMIILDSGHLQAHHTQNEFLEEHLKAFSHLPFRTAVYHVPLYPSHRDYEGGASVAGRTHWLPLFDAYSLSVGFENHDHTFKRTKLLRNNEVNPEGTLYVGDGNAGVMPRTVNEDLWYMERVGRESHFWIVDVSAEQMHLSALDRMGNIFDQATVEARTVK